ncbi:elongation factor P maturation arginine rhamnosyltransferase EarP [Piscinibacter koreensis]|uniref:Protein-arginine rhamnosyltransferase n=1 Tax=Piscinibacter koreensis TaxID=2742824 RepID=A0A7Y6NNB3_9BURK|nr:elongation factor P maturation arginine rhamnosyltransferase EarP [Schlegelella koreensis]NUZ06294.1 elongation factor P maturation arginine rhamnosyltransferase EarP [Schlegelella koreensis]
MRWDLFCRVIDNHGDAGVCWRLAADLAQRGEFVRLWVDDASALSWMAPEGCAGVEVRGWPDGRVDRGEARLGDVVIEAFGCELPAHVRERLFERDPAPVWINLEYLTAEPYAARAHGLASPQFDPAGRRVDKWFFYPGFDAASGGLIREPWLLERLAAVEPRSWLAANGIDARPEERVVSIFCYRDAPLDALVGACTDRPTLLLATPGHATSGLAATLGAEMRCGAVRALSLPYRPQPDFDALLAASAVCLVRGEDSFVRAQWAGRPFVWQIYPQDDAAHHVKLAAFLNVYLQGAEPSLAGAIRAWFEGWNGLGALPRAWPDLAAWQAHARGWRDRLAAQTDLTARLLDFVAAKS